MIVVSEASPLINFAIIGYLDLLPKLFGGVVNWREGLILKVFFIKELPAT